jgi:integrase
MPRHRGHGEGSVVQRPNGRWQAQISVGGRRLTHTANSKAEALRWVREHQSRAEQGLLPPDGGKVTLGAFLVQWLRAIEPSVEPKTFEQYSYLVRVHLAPKGSRLADLRLVDLRADHLQVLYAEKLDAGLSSRTVQLMHVVLHHALEDAVRWGRLARNPAKAATAPRTRRAEMHVWSAEQARAFLAGVEGQRLEPLYRLALSCGLRLGELLALRWDDVDLDGRRLQVRRTLQRIKGKGIVTGQPKSTKGRRQIVLPGPVVEGLRHWRVQQKEERLIAGQRWQDTGYVFTTGVGTSIEPRNLHRHFKQRAERLSLPTIRFHDLRHTCATVLLSQGVHPKFVQELLGHANISITLDTYSHFLPPMAEETARTMERVLLGT